MPEGERDGRRATGLAHPLGPLVVAGKAAAGLGWAGLGCVLTGQRPVLVVQGLGQVLNSGIMLVT